MSIMLDESPTPVDVLADAMLPDHLDSFLATIIDMPSEEFCGCETMSGVEYHSASTPLSAMEHAPRCFIGQAIVKAPERYDYKKYGGCVAFVAEIYHVLRYMVDYIYTRVVELRFAGAVQFARDTVAAHRRGDLYLHPRLYEVIPDLNPKIAESRPGDDN